MSSSTSTSTVMMKKGWRRFAAAVVCLVFFSMLVPLFFLLGLYGHLPSGYVTDEGPSTLNQQNDSKVVGVLNHDAAVIQRERNISGNLENIHSKLGSARDSVNGDFHEPINTSATNMAAGGSLTSAHNFSGVTHESLDKLITRHPIKEGFSEKQISHSLPNNRTEKKVEESHNIKSKNDSSVATATAEFDKACELALGSYCNWRDEHRVEVTDATVRVLKNQLFLARAYYPSIAKHRNREKFQQELRRHIQDIERMLSEATADADLPPRARKKIAIMDEVLAKVKTFPIDCNNVAKKLGQILDLTEDEARFHRKQSVYLYQLAIQTMPKSLHCLSMRLTVEYFRSYQRVTEMSSSNKLENTELYHYVIYSKNVLAASVAVNSTIAHAKEPKKHVFHLITDRENFIAMKFWFLQDNYNNATVDVQSLHDLKLNISNLSIPSETLSSEEFRVATELTDGSFTQPAGFVKKPKYLSTFNHPHFWLPEIFPKLKKVLLLDDDVVVQRDLTPLWSIDLQEKVNGAVELCDIRFHHFSKYLNNSDFYRDGFDGNACAWTSGLNIINLQQWRRKGLTKTYQKWLELQTGYNIPPRFGTLPASLITFYNSTYALSNSWLTSGLGHDYGIDQQSLRKAAVLHYNGNLKPWLEIGIKKYKSHWSKYLKRGDQFLLECNVAG